MANKENTVILAENIKKIYRRGGEEVLAVNDIHLTIEKGDFVAITGPSGSGKTTLLNVLGCLDNPTSGRILLSGQVIFEGQKGLSEHDLTKIRRQMFGYIFQKFYLIPTLTVLENILVPLTFYRKNTSPAQILDVIAYLGLEHRLNHLPVELSGGEMQRLAIARALVNRPAVLLADEPTGNLDTKRGEEIGHILKKLNEEDNLTIVLVTHNLNLARIAKRTVELRDGRIFRYS